MIVSVSGSSVRNCLAAARAHLGLRLKDSREVTRSGGEDGLYRSELSDGTVVESTVAHHATTGEILVH